MLDAHCVRAVDQTGIAETIEWWAAHGEARVNRAHRSLRVVPPLLHGALENYWAFVCSCRRRREGDVVGGFALIRGDGSRVHWYRPPDAATLTMLSVLVAEALVFAHMFIYCRCGGGQGGDWEGSALRAPHARKLLLPQPRGRPADARHPLLRGQLPHVEHLPLRHGPATARPRRPPGEEEEEPWPGRKRTRILPHILPTLRSTSYPCAPTRRTCTTRSSCPSMSRRTPPACARRATAGATSQRRPRQPAGRSLVVLHSSLRCCCEGAWAGTHLPSARCLPRMRPPSRPQQQQQRPSTPACTLTTRRRQLPPAPTQPCTLRMRRMAAPPRHPTRPQHRHRLRLLPQLTALLSYL